MHTQVASKVTSFAVAVLMNGLMLAGVSYLFDSQAHAQPGVVASAGASTQTPAGEAA